MDIRIQAKNIDLNPHAEQYIQKKFDRLQRHLPNLDDAKMEVSRTQARATRDRVEAQMTLNIAGIPPSADRTGESICSLLSTQSQT